MNRIIRTLLMASIVALAGSSDSAVNAKAPASKVVKSHKRQQSRFSKEFSDWAAKQDWFALSDKAEFGDLNRGKCVEKGMTFGYSVEFVDSRGKKHILGIGLGTEPEQEEKRSRKRHMVEMCASKNIMMHGKPVLTGASGVQRRCASGTISGMTCLLCKTILRSGTDQKWILCVCTGKPSVDNMAKDNECPRNGR